MDFDGGTAHGSGHSSICHWCMFAGFDSTMVWWTLVLLRSLLRFGAVRWQTRAVWPALAGSRCQVANVVTGEDVV